MTNDDPEDLRERLHLAAQSLRNPEITPHRDRPTVPDGAPPDRHSSFSPLSFPATSTSPGKLAGVVISPPRINPLMKG